MNRGIALFVALAMLLAHALAIHDDGEGRFAFPYDQAYVALRLARNLVFENQLAWNPGWAAFESYPSAAWVVVCAVAERIGPPLGISTNLSVQSLGILSSLAILVVISRFRAERSASLIAPLFLAASGGFAAAGASGLEIAPFTLFAAAAFYALERGRSVWFAACASLVCLTRPEGIVLVAAFAALRAFGRPNDDEGAPRFVAWAAFTAPVGLFLGVAILRTIGTGFFLAPDLHALLFPAEGQWREGFASLREFAVVAVIPLLLVFPAAYLVRGQLSRTGAHAVFLALAWCSATALLGRGTLPFHMAFVPALPFIALAVQEGMITALDGVSTLRRRLTLFAFGAGLVGSGLASRIPADLGPLPIQQVHEAWVRPRESARFDGEQPLARMGLMEEIEVTRRLRKAGIFLRDNVDQSASVLTPWPGAIGYLSRLTVHDVLGRTDPLHPLDRPRPWSRPGHVDIVAVLGREADFVVPYSTLRRSPPTLGELARTWMEGLDSRASEPGRIKEVERALAGYELITVPIEDYTRERASIGREPFLLLRHSRLRQRPQLSIERVDDGVRVCVKGARHVQLAELEIRLQDDAGRAFTLRPTGELDPTATARTRLALLLYDSGTREMELCRMTLPPHPAGGRWVSATARLLNPGSHGEGDPWEAVSDRASVPW